MIIDRDNLYCFVWNKDTDSLENIVTAITTFNIKTVHYNALPEFRFYDFSIDGEVNPALNKLRELLTNNRDIEFFFYTSAVKDEYLLKLLESENFPLHLIKIVSWPTYFINFLLVNNTFEPLGGTLKTDKEKLFCSFNRNPHEFRAKFLDNLSRFNLLYKNLISWPFGNNTSFNYNFWNPEILKIDNVSDILDNPAPNRNSPEIISSCLFEVVTESNVFVTFYTEKTFKAILNKMPFLILGVKGANTYLQKIGIELYTEVIDYSFDKLDTWQERCLGLSYELNRLDKLFNTVEKRNEIRDILAPIVDKNYNTIMDIFENNRYVPEEIFKFNEYVGNSRIITTSHLQELHNSLRL